MIKHQLTLNQRLKTHHVAEVEVLAVRLVALAQPAHLFGEGGQSGVGSGSVDPFDVDAQRPVRVFFRSRRRRRYRRRRSRRRRRRRRCRRRRRRRRSQRLRLFHRRMLFGQNLEMETDRFRWFVCLKKTE